MVKVQNNCATMSTAPLRNSWVSAASSRSSQKLYARELSNPVSNPENANKRHPSEVTPAMSSAGAFQSYGNVDHHARSSSEGRHSNVSSNCASTGSTVASTTVSSMYDSFQPQGERHRKMTRPDDVNSILGTHVQNPVPRGGKTTTSMGSSNMATFDLEDDVVDEKRAKIEKAFIAHALNMLTAIMAILALLISMTIAGRELWVLDMTCSQIQNVFSTLECDGQMESNLAIPDANRLVRVPWGFNEAPATVLLAEQESETFLRHSNTLGGVPRILHAIVLSGTKLSIKERLREKRTRPQIPAEYIGNEVQEAFMNSAMQAPDHKKQSDDTEYASPDSDSQDSSAGDLNNLDDNTEEQNERLLENLMQRLNQHNAFFLPKQHAVFQEHWMDGTWDYGRDTEQFAPIYHYYYWTDADVEYLVDEFSRNFRKPGKRVEHQRGLHSNTAGATAVQQDTPDGNVPDFSWVRDVYHHLPNLEIKAEFAKYLIMFRFGGVFASVDTELLDAQTFETFLRSYDIRDQPGRNVAFFLGERNESRVTGKVKTGEEFLNTALVIASAKHPVFAYILQVMGKRNPPIAEAKPFVSDFDRMKPGHYKYLKTPEGKPITSLDQWTIRTSLSKSINQITKNDHAMLNAVNPKRFAKPTHDQAVDNFMLQSRRYSGFSDAGQFAEGLSGFYNFGYSWRIAYDMPDFIFTVGSAAVTKGIELWQRSHMPVVDASSTDTIGDREGRSGLVTLPKVHVNRYDANGGTQTRSNPNNSYSDFDVLLLEPSSMSKVVYEHKSHDHTWQRRRNTIASLCLACISCLIIAFIVSFTLTCLLLVPVGITSRKLKIASFVTGKRSTDRRLVTGVII